MVGKHTRAYTVRPVLAQRPYRRKFAYPIVTLCVAGIVYLMSRGQIAMHAPAAPQEYEAFAREVVMKVRAGLPVPNARGPLIEQQFTLMAPESVRKPEGGALTYEFAGSDPAAVIEPSIQRVVVRGADGEGVSLSISIVEGTKEVAGVARVDRKPVADAASGATAGERP
jgi:hypothetical protein